MESSGTTTVSATAAANATANTSNHVQISRKRVKVSSQTSHHRQQQEIQWRNPAQAKIYRHRLIDSLRNLNINSGNADDDVQSRPKPTQSPRRPPPPRAIKDAADAALAMTARGQSRWSRAILSRRWRMRKVVMAKPKVKKRKKEREAERGEKKKVRDRLRLLGHLVPGCRKVCMTDLLEETADYVAALELQVKAMKALSDALSASTSASSAPPPPLLPSHHHADHAAPTASSHDHI